MDDQGRKVVVCDNGTGVSSLSEALIFYVCYVACSSMIVQLFFLYHFMLKKKIVIWTWEFI